MKESPYAKYKEDFISLYKSGKSVREIAREYGVKNHTTVSNIIKKDIELRPKTFLTDEKVLEALSLYKKGHTINSIAKKFKVSNETLKNRLSKHVKIESNFKYEELVDYIKEDYKNGMSSWEIADKYSLSAQTVCNYLHIEQEEVRESGEANRKYLLDVDYFKLENLNEESAFDLGAIFSKIRFYSHNRFKITGSLIDYDETYKDIICKFSSLDKTLIIKYEDYFIYEISSVEFSVTLKNTLDNIFKSKFIDSFMNGLITYNSSVTKKHITLNALYLNKEELKNYIVSLGIDRNSILNFSKNTLSIQQKANVYKLTEKYPVILKDIRERAKSIKIWENFLNTYYKE